MECCVNQIKPEMAVQRSSVLQTMQVAPTPTRPVAESFAETGVEIFAENGVIVVVIHCGRYQITIEVE